MKDTAVKFLIDEISCRFIISFIQKSANHENQRFKKK